MSESPEAHTGDLPINGVQAADNVQETSAVPVVEDQPAVQNQVDAPVETADDAAPAPEEEISVASTAEPAAPVDAVETLHRNGVLTLDVPADRLSVAVIEKYLELKGRGML